MIRLVLKKVQKMAESTFWVDFFTPGQQGWKMSFFLGILNLAKTCVLGLKSPQNSILTLWEASEAFKADIWNIRILLKFCKGTTFDLTLTLILAVSATLYKEPLSTLTANFWHGRRIWGHLVATFFKNRKTSFMASLWTRRNHKNHHFHFFVQIGQHCIFYIQNPRKMGKFGTV